MLKWCFFLSSHPNRSLRTLFNIFKLEIHNLMTIGIWRCEGVPPLSNAQVWNFRAKDMGWSEVLLGTWGGGGWGGCGTIGNPLRTLMRTHWELDENAFGTRKNPNNPTSTLSKRKIKLGPSGVCWLTSFAGKNFYAYLCSLPFLA